MTSACSYFDEDGRLVQELTNHRGVTKTVRYLLDEDTMVSRKPLRRASITCSATLFVA